MMARTIREQMVAYVAPPLAKRTKRVVAQGRARGERITISSLIEEMMRETISVWESRYLEPTHGARKEETTLA